MHHPRLVLALVVVTAMLSACAALPDHVPRSPSQALDGRETRLGRVAAASAPSASGDVERQAAAAPAVATDAAPLLASNASHRSGFRLVPSGEEAYAILYALISDAERSLDLQYYIVQDDPYARALLRAVREAAGRGVRVRLLVDDFYTTGKDARIMWYAEHPNIEVRVFNPFASGRARLATRLLGSIADVDRINHRMHNKMFVADNAFAVTGGRNVGAEYYTHSSRTNFLDLDVLAAGPIVQDLSAVFDDYWNSRYAFPIEALAPRPSSKAISADERVLSDPSDPVRFARFEAEDQGRAIQAEIDAGRVALVEAAAVLIADLPSKVDQSAPRVGPQGLQGATIATDIVSIMKNAKEELVIITPYFVPGERGVAVIRELIAKGVRVRIVTNSLSATDAVVVHIGYAKYRKALLEAGAEMYEIRPEPGNERERLTALGSSKASLHAKALAVDRKTIFVGSFNVDQRSAYENTEMGIEIASHELGEQLVGRLRVRGDEGRYQVTLDEGRLRWTTKVDGVERVYDDEPEAGTGLKLMLKLLAPFAPEEML